MKPLHRVLVGSLLALVSASAFAATDTYTLDPDHTQVLFSWNHFGFSDPTAEFDKVEGTLVFDADDPTKSSVSVTIPVKSVHTHVPALDEHFQGADFFDSAKYPDITFKSTRVERGAGADQLKVFGDLSIHGVTRPETLDVRIVKVAVQPMWKAPAAGFEAAAELKRSDFGVKTYVPMVSDAIRIRISTEAIDAKAYAAAMKAYAASKK